MKQKKRKYSSQKVIIKSIREEEFSFWKHPGGKLLHTGSDKLTDAELME